jgi:hypothetical protein
MINRVQPIAKIVFLTFITLTYVVKPALSYWYNDSQYDFFTFQGLSLESHLFAVLSIFIFYIFFLIGYRINIKNYSGRQIRPVSHLQQKDLTAYVMLAMTLLFILKYQDGTSAYLVVLLSVCYIFYIYNILLGGIRAWFSIALVFSVAYYMIGSKSIVLLSFACLFLLLFKKAVDFNFFRHRYILMIILIIFIVPVVGVLQVLRWNHGDINVLNLELIFVGFATTFDGYETLCSYYDSFYKIPFFTWISEFWLLIPRGLVENKPLVYGAGLISEYFYPGAFFINDSDGSGGGQFPPSVVLLAVDFLWLPGLFIYPLFIGFMLRSIDDRFTYGSYFDKAIAIYLVLQLNTLVRSGLISYLIYSLVIIFCAYLVYYLTNWLQRSLKI